MMWGLGLSFSAIVALCAVGLRNGGNIEMVKIQVQTFVLLLSMAYLLAVTMRGHRDHRTLAILIVAAACIKALLALYVSLTGRVLTNGDDPAFATTHGDSILFACAVVIMTVRFAETPIRRNAYLCLLILPLLTGGMMANNRRLVWVEIAVAAVAYCFITRRHLKKTFARAALVVVPLAIAYVAIGWNSQAEIFAPVQLFRSVGDGEVNRSTMYRDIENYNLLYTIRWNPLVGTGFGHPFSEIVPLDDISFFQEYRYMPHNSILGLWAYAGVFGYTGLSLALVIAVFLAARSYNLARKSDERVAAFSVIAMIVIYEIHCWGDIGFSERHSVFLVSEDLAVAGQLAVSTGAWGTGQQHSRTRLADHVVG
jgi:O-antigen ligase